MSNQPTAPTTETALEALEYLDIVLPVFEKISPTSNQVALFLNVLNNIKDRLQGIPPSLDED